MAVFWVLNVSFHLAIILCTARSQGDQDPEPPTLAPTGVETIPLGARELRVEWIRLPSSIPVTGYMIVTVPSNGEAEPMQNVVFGERITRHVFTGLRVYEYFNDTGVEYSTVVRAFNSFGNGPYSNTSVAILPPCPGACNYRNFRENDTDCSRTSCICNRAFTGEECSEPTFGVTNLNLTTTSDGLVTVGWRFPDIFTLDGRLVVMYRINVTAIDSTNTRDTVSSVNTLPSQNIVTINVDNTTLNYLVTVETVTDVEGDIATVESYIINVPPGPVVRVMAEPFHTSIYLTWEPPTTFREPLTAYTIEYFHTDSQTSSTLQVDSTVLNATLTDLSPGSTFSITVRAVNDNQRSTGAIITVTTLPTVCEANFFGLISDVECTPCPNGSVSPVGSQLRTNCTCLPGYEGSNGESCRACTIGSFKPYEGPGSCLPCDALLTTTITGSVVCDACRYSRGTPGASVPNGCYPFETSTTLFEPVLSDSVYDETTNDISLSLTFTLVGDSVFNVDGNSVGTLIGYEAWCTVVQGLVPERYTHVTSMNVTASSQRIVFTSLLPLVEYQFNVTLIAERSRTATTELFGRPSPSISFITQAGQSDASLSALPQITGVNSTENDVTSVTVLYSIHPNVIGLISRLQLQYYANATPTIDLDTFQSIPFTLSDLSSRGELTVNDLSLGNTFTFRLQTEIGIYNYSSNVVEYLVGTLPVATTTEPSQSTVPATATIELRGSTVPVTTTIEPSQSTVPATATIELRGSTVPVTTTIELSQSTVPATATIELRGSTVPVTTTIEPSQSTVPATATIELRGSTVPVTTTIEPSQSTVSFSTSLRTSQDTNVVQSAAAATSSFNSISTTPNPIIAVGRTSLVATNTRIIVTTNNAIQTTSSILDQTRSEQSTVLVMSVTPTPTPSLPPQPVLPAPQINTNISQVINATDIIVTWSVLTNSSGYTVKVYEINGQLIQTISVIGEFVTEQHITGLSPFTIYIVRIAGVAPGGAVGELSEPFQLTTSEASPGPPSNVTVEELAGGEFINVTWSPPLKPNGIITGYIVMIQLVNGSAQSFDYNSTQRSTLLPKPDVMYSVSVIAVNSAGASIPEIANVVTVEEPTKGTFFTRTVIIAGSAAIGGVVVLSLTCLFLLLVCCCRYIYHRKRKTGRAEFSEHPDDYTFQSGLEYESGSGMTSEKQLTAKRWMRLHGNYNSSSAVIAPLSQDLYNDHSHIETNMYAEVTENERMRGYRPILQPPKEHPLPDVLQTLKDATPTDYNNEELYMEMEKVYFADTDEDKTLEPFEMPRSMIEIKEELGHGEFGRVLKATAKNVIPRESESTVAVKMLKEGASDNVRRDFLGEARMLAKFKHPNVLELLKVVTKNEPILVIIPFMGNGDLKSYLKGKKKKKKRMSQMQQPSSNVDVDFGAPQQLEIGEQVAAGMEYLAARYFIHRDLAARNILVGDGNKVKIADFGLSRTLAKENTYYHLTETKKLPVKWMALESLLYRKFSTYSDVWSFGVVLWEVFAYGDSPYKGIKAMDIANHIQKGGRLSCPDECPQNVFELMQQCWKKTKEQRPSFTDLKLQLKAYRLALKKENNRRPLLESQN